MSPGRQQKTDLCCKRPEEWSQVVKNSIGGGIRPVLERERLHLNGVFRLGAGREKLEGRGAGGMGGVRDLMLCRSFPYVCPTAVV